MKRRNFIRTGRKLYGNEAWQSALASALGVHRTTIWRYATGRTPIPKRIIVALDELKGKRDGDT